MASYPEETNLNFDILHNDFDAILRPTLGPNVAAIICEIRRYWVILEKIFKLHGDIRRYWAILCDTGRYYAILGDIRRYWAILGDIERY